MYEKRLLVLGGEDRGCLKMEKLSDGVYCVLSGNLKCELIMAINCGTLYAFGPFRLSGGYKFRLPDVNLSEISVAVGDMTGALVMSGSFRRPAPWRGNLVSDIKRACERLGITPRVHRDINDFFLNIIPTEYDDGKVAEVNYYKSNLSSSKQIEQEKSEIQEETATTVSNAEIVSENDEDNVLEFTPAKETQEDFTRTQIIPEMPPVTFYDSIKEQVERLFSKNSRYEKLEKLLPDSKWIKIDYDGSGKYYLVGTIGEPVKYLCYGVPGEYSPNPPPDLVGYCQWLALDERDPSGKGFWIMYQDGVSGKSVL